MMIMEELLDLMYVLPSQKRPYPIITKDMVDRKRKRSRLIYLPKTSTYLIGDLSSFCLCAGCRKPMALLKMKKIK